MRRSAHLAGVAGAVARAGDQGLQVGARAGQAVGACNASQRSDDDARTGTTSSQGNTARRFTQGKSVQKQEGRQRRQGRQGRSRDGGSNERR